MRPLLAIAVWVVLVGGLSWYMQTREEIAAVPEFELKTLDTKLTLEITPSFTVVPDPFALLVDKQDQRIALLVRLNGRDILTKTKQLARGSHVIVSDVQGLVEGRNELYVEAYPSLKEASLAHAIRIRMRRDHGTIAEQTLWSEPGSRIAATINLELSSHKITQDEGHGH